MSNTANFLFELGAEELPAGQIKAITNHIKQVLTSSIESADLNFEDTYISFSPRRIFIEIQKINLDSEDKVELIKGPPEKIAQAEDGSFTQAALGFAKKNNLAEQDLYFENGYLCAKQTVKAKNIEDVLSESIPKAIESTPGVRFMRWANGDLKFARPIQWLVAVLDYGKESKTIECSIENTKTSNQSYGHRFLGPEAIEVKNKEQYFADLEKQGVILDFEKRKERIISESKQLAKSIEGEAVFTDDLLEELCLITENPNPILCEFEKHFLKVPSVVLKTVMVSHQRYIPIESNDLDESDVTEHRLLPYFIAVSNNPKAEAIENIKSGNEKVIRPRFNDAEFFTKEDLKTKLEDRLEKLSRLNFLKGNVLEKTKRIEKLSAYLIEKLKSNYAQNPAKNTQDHLDDKSKAAILEAAKLCKADLTCNLVFEFTELQGLIGGIYAERQHKDPVTAGSIKEHYKPCFAGDTEPSTIGAKIISIADKLDNIVCAFALGKIPSGSADPFALRRQANGLLETVIHGHLILNIEDLIDESISLLKSDFGNGEMITKIKGRGEKRQEITVAELEWEESRKKLIEFFEQRLEFVFEEFHKDKEVNKAALSKSHPLKELNKRHMMIHTLMDLRERPGDFANFTEAASRILNISKKDLQEQNGNSMTVFKEKIEPALFELDNEKSFYQAVSSLDKIKDQNENYKPLLSRSEIIDLVEPINKFFDNVMVNTEDEKIRDNRKALVAYAGSLVQEIGDFSLL